MIAKTADMVDRPWLVQKFGGTSLGKLLPNICSTIIPNYNEKHRLVVVCSALSGNTKASGTTSLLLECIELAEFGVPMQQKLLDIIHLLRDNHLAVLDSFCGSEQLSSLQVCKETKPRIVTECEALENFLLAAQIVGELSPRAKDRVVSSGEKLASVIVAACLSNQGIPATAVYLDDVVASAFGNSASDQAAAFDKLGSKFYHAIAKEIALRIKNCGETIPIVTGFFGIMPNSLIQTVGRGYSDFCAAMCAVAVEAVELQIWKEVDGIFTADPRKIPSAQLLPSVTADEIAELSYYGSEVLHPLTMDQICEANISLRLKNVFKPNSPGTIIDSAVNKPQTIKITPPPGVLLKGDFTVGRNERRRPTAVTIKDDILLINVVCNRNTKSGGLLVQVFRQLEKHNIPIDLITTSERNVSLAVHSPGDSSAVLRLEEELKSFGSVNITESMSIVTLVGHKMRSQIGVANDALTALAMAGINIHLISQGASEISISFVVGANEAEPALYAIHRDVLKIPTIEESRFRRRAWLY